MTQQDRTQPLDFSGYDIPSHTADALNNLWVNGWIPGGFLQAVFRNDLRAVIAKADHINAQYIPEIVMFVYYELPSYIITEVVKKGTG